MLPSGKVTFSVTLKLTPPTVFNLQALDWVNCEEETGAYYHLSRFSYLYIFNLKKTKLKLLIFRKKYTLFKKIAKILLFIKKKKIFGHTCLCTKCNDNFKFTIFLKSYEE